MSILENARKTRHIIEQAVKSLDDNTALEAVSLFTKWEAGMDVAPGDRRQYGGKLYKVKDGKGHTTQADWTPDVATSLFEAVNKTHSGTADDPIPYDGNMVLTAGLYYSQNDAVYLCTRDTGIAVYNALADLVGLYVEQYLRK